MYYIDQINLHPYFTFSNGSFIKLPLDLVDDVNYITSKAKAFNAKPFLLLIDVMEGRMYEKQMNPVIDEIRKVLNSYDVEYRFVLDGDFEEYSELEKNEDIIYSNFLVLTAYAYTVSSDAQKTSNHWNNLAPKGLYMPGKPDRPHRAKLMSKLWEQDKLDKLDWSFSITDEEAVFIRQQLLDYDLNTFQKFRQETFRFLDLRPTDSNRCFSYNGYPYNHELYEGTSFSVIAESDFSANINGTFNYWPKLTEKTYRTIANRHPFICSWYPGMTDHIERMGFKSFKEYMMIPEYNNIQDLGKRLDATIHNIEFFTTMANKPSNVDKIREDIEHNYNHFLYLARKELEKVQWLFDLPQTDNIDFRMYLHRYVCFMFPIVYADRNWEPNWLS